MPDRIGSFKQRTRNYYGWNTSGTTFHYTVDAPVADAGPWLVDLHAAQPTHLDALAQLEQACPAVSWIFSELAPDDLARHLRQRLEIGLPDGSPPSARSAARFLSRSATKNSRVTSVFWRSVQSQYSGCESECGPR